MSSLNSQIDWATMQKVAGPYPIEAFDFVREGLGFTVGRVQEKLSQQEEFDPEDDHHVSGQELCLGLRDFAINQYGLMAMAVLDHWNVTRTDDFGRMVFAMIKFNLMSKNDNDTMADFAGVYEFSSEFASDRVARQLLDN